MFPRFPLIFCVSFSICIGAIQGNVPQWWNDYDVGPNPSVQSDLSSIKDNYQPALLGQAKYMAYQAWQAMEAKEKGSGGETIEQLVKGFSTQEDDNYQILLLGQLKAIVQPFYQKFQERGYDVAQFNIEVSSSEYPYPWIDPSTPGYDVDLNYQPANIGQLKYLFSFGLENWGLKPLFTLDTPVDGNPATSEIETNALSIVLSGTLDTTNFGQFSINGKTIQSVTQSGAFSFTYPLNKEGENQINALLEDQSGNAVEQSLSVYRITEAPQIDIDTPASAETSTHRVSYNLSGSVGTSASVLKVNNTELTFEENGSFIQPISLEEGLNIYSFAVEDALGNLRQVQREITLDTVAPTLLNASLIDGQLVNNSQVQFSGSLSEAGSLMVNGQMVMLGSDQSFNQSIALVEGVNTITVLIRDVLGNLITQQIQVNLDLSSPIITLMQPTNGLMTSEDSVSVIGSVDDEEATLTLNGEAVSLIDGAFSTSVALVEGSNEFLIRATDSAGNGTQSTLKILRDSIGPAFIQLSPFEDGTTGSSYLEVSGKVDDSSAEVVIALNGNPLPVRFLSGEFEAFGSLVEGANTLVVTASDPTGNSTTESFTIHFDASTSAPVLLDSPHYTSSDRLASISGTAEPSASISVSGGLSPVIVEVDENGNFATSTLLLEPNSVNNLVFRAIDPYGNEAQTALQVVTDTIVPQIILHTPEEASTSQGLDVPVIGKVTDANLGDVIQINGNDIHLHTEGQFSTTITFEAGEQSLTLGTSDLAGNVADQVIRAFTVSDPTVDTTAPTVAVVSPQSNSIIASVDTTLELFLSDASGIASLQINGILADISSLAEGYLSLPVTFDASGSLDLVVTDNAEPANATTLSHRVVIDATPPTVPTIRLLSPASPTNTDEVSLYASIDPDTSYRVSGALISSLEGRSDSNGRFTVSLPLSKNDSNTFSVAAIAENGLQNSIDVEVIHDSFAPELAATSPSMGATGVALGGAIELTLSEPIQESSATGIVLSENGETRSFTFSYDSNAYLLTIVPDQAFAESSDITVSLPEPLADLAGNLLTGNRFLSFQTQDLTPPETPSDIAASRTMTHESEVEISGTAEPGSTITVEGGATRVMTAANESGDFSISVELNPNTVNSLSITATDAAGNVSDAATIEVEHNNTAFVLNTYSPSGENSPTDTSVTLTFNQEVDPNTIADIALVGSGIGVVPSSVGVHASSSSLLLTPNSSLIYSTSYTVVIPSTVLDQYGNHFTPASPITFTTVAADTPPAPFIRESYPEDLTNKDLITISAFATPGTVVTIHGGSSTITFPENGVVDNTGEFAIQVPLALDQENTITLTAAFPDGNPSVDSEPIVIVQDSTPPAVNSVLPSGNSVDVTSAITVSFSEPVIRDSFSAFPASVQLLDAQNRMVNGYWVPSNDASLWAYYPSQNLSAGSSYTVLINSTLKDLAGNAILASESHSFTTSASTTPDSDLVAAPEVAALDFSSTLQPTVTYHGTAEPNTTLYVLGGREVVSTTVDANGHFSINVPLIMDSKNQLLVYVEDENGVPGFSVTLNVEQSSRETGIRIQSPIDGWEYNNRSVTLVGYIDNPSEIDAISVVENYTYLPPIWVGDVSQIPSNGSKAVRVTTVDETLYFRIFERNGNYTDFVETDYPDKVTSLDIVRSLVSEYEDFENGYDETADFDNIGNQLSELVFEITEYSKINEVKESALFGGFFLAQLIFDDAEIEVVEKKSFTVFSTLKNGSIIKDSVEFDIFIEPEGEDSRAPIPLILFPEEGQSVTSEFMDVMAVVEEGVALNSVIIDGVTAHHAIGNLFFILTELEEQGENEIVLEARDEVGLVAFDRVKVVLDSISVEVPTITTQVSSTFIEDRVLTLEGTGEAGSYVVVRNGLVPVRVRVDSDGTFSIKVPLNPNETNRLEIYGSDDAGNLSSSVELEIEHDDAAPFIVSSYPVDHQIGVAPDNSITLEFSEPLLPSSVNKGVVSITSELEGSIDEFNVHLSADGSSIEIDPEFKFQRGDTISLELSTGVRDENGLPLADPYSLSFDTALYNTTLSGVVVDRDIEPLQSIKVGILGTDIYQRTSSFGTFVLDEVPTGDHVLYVDARPDESTELSPQGDDRVFNYLEFPIFVEQNTDNSLGRPIFMVDTDFSTETAVQHLTDSQTLTFQSERSDLEGFEMLYQAGAARFVDGTDRGGVTVTRIPADRVPDRLPSGAIPHFLVEIGPDALSFSTPVSLRFPDVYDLKEGDEVIVFHFQHGLADYKEIARLTIGADHDIFVENASSESGFVGYVPVGGNYDYTRAYLEGRVVDGIGNGIEGISVNAIAGSTYVVTDASGYYRIPLPEVRLLMIQTFATISTRQNDSGSDSEAPELIYPSEQIELATSGTTHVPDIVIDSFTLEGSIRFFDTESTRLGLTGYGTDDDGYVTGIDPGDAKLVNVFVYRRLGNNSGLPIYDSVPYMQTVCDLSELLDLKYDASFSMTFLGSLNESASNPDTPAPKPGDTIKIVAFDSHTGLYGEVDLLIEAPSEGSNSMMANLDLYPPQLELDMNRVFYIDGIRQRLNIPNEGIVFTDDEFVEFKTKWVTAKTTPLKREELTLHARLRVKSIDYQTDYRMKLEGGEQFQILEIREALYPERLQVLQRETDVGVETFTVSRDGSFTADSLIPVQVIGNSYGLGDGSGGTVSSLSLDPMFNVIELDIRQLDDGTLDVGGRALPGQKLNIGGTQFTANGSGYFGNEIDGTLGDGGISVGIGDTEALFGAKYTPEIYSLDPGVGSQGDVITITGIYFSVNPQDNKVSFNGAAAQVLQASQAELSVVVPNGASSGDVTVTVSGEVSNGVFFDFVSLGINNGSFEDGRLRGYQVAGTGSDVTVVDRMIRFAPTHRLYMAQLDTSKDPSDGVATLTTDKFYIPAGMKTILLDFSLHATASFQSLQSHLEFEVIADGSVYQLEPIGIADLESFPLYVSSGHSTGSDFQTVALDISTFTDSGGQISGTPIQLVIRLKGCGDIPEELLNRYPGDHNILDITKVPGTSLLVDNVRLSAASASVPIPIDPGQFTSNLNGDILEITFESGVFPIGSDIFLRSVNSGETWEFDVDDTETLSIQIDHDFGDYGDTLLIKYVLPDSQENGSNRIISAPCPLSIPASQS